MALFDFSRQQRMLPAGAMKQSPYVPIEEQRAPRQRRGLFSGLTRRDDGDPGTFLNYFLFGRNGVQDMRDSRMRRDMFNFNMEGAKREREQEAQQQRAIEEAIGTLDPSMQAWARIAPEAAARGQFEQPSDRYGDLERIDGRLGQRNQATGQYDWAPQVPIESRPPSGYRYTPGGDLEAIRGGPAAIEAEHNATARLGRFDTTERQLSNSIDVLNSVLGTNERGESIGESQIRDGTTGVWAERTREWGINQDAENLYQALEPVVANIGFEALAEMRRNSETGGALGNVAVREIELLQRTVRSLATSQSAAQLRSNAEAVRNQLVVVRNAVTAARRELVEMQGGGGAPSGNEIPVIELD